MSKAKTLSCQKRGLYRLSGTSWIVFVLLRLSKRLEKEAGEGTTVTSIMDVPQH